MSFPVNINYDAGADADLSVWLLMEVLEQSPERGPRAELW